MDICQWCWKLIDESEIPNFHEHCVVAMADLFDYLDTEAHTWETKND